MWTFRSEVKQMHKWIDDWKPCALHWERQWRGQAWTLGAEPPQNIVYPPPWDGLIKNQGVN